MNSPNVISHESTNTSEDLPTEGTSWANPGKFPAFMSGLKNAEAVTGVESSNTKKASLETLHSINQDLEKTLLPEYVESNLFDRLATKILILQL